MSYIFVGGAARAGTSLLQLLLCQDGATNPMVREAGYLANLAQAYYLALEDFENDTRDYFDTTEDLRIFHSEIVLRFLEQTLARFCSAEHLVLKNPHLTSYFPSMYELVPSSRFIIIVRDPRDAISSMLTVGEKLASEGHETLFTNRNMKELCEYYNRFYAPAFSYLDPEFRKQLLVIKYENLVLMTKSVVDRLRCFTGLTLAFNHDREFDSGSLNYSNLEKRYRPWYTAKYGGRIDPSSVGQYRENLSVDEINAIKHHCTDICTAFGYQ